MKWSDAFKSIADHCSDLTAYGVQPRYPAGFVLEEQDILQALNSAVIIQEFIMSLASDFESNKLSTHLGE